MTLPRNRPPFVADERTQLVGWLDMQRAIVQWKCEGLSEDDAHRSVLPSSPLMTVAGLVSHLRLTEHCWFEVLFLGRPADGPQFQEEPEDADMMVDDVGKHPDFTSAAGSLRWMLIHMVEETGRHAGHLDIIRELLDGQKGYY
jgi:hypothetical protein